MLLVGNHFKSILVHCMCKVLSRRLKYVTIAIFCGIHDDMVSYLYTVVKVEHCLCVGVWSADFFIHFRGILMKVKG